MYYSNLTEIYAKLSQPDSAKFYLNKINYNSSLQHKANKYLHLYKIAKYSGNTQDALKHHEDLYNVKDSIYQRDKEHQVEVISEKYKSQLYQTQLIETRRHRDTMIIICILLSLIIISLRVVILYMRKYVLVKKEQELDNYKESVIIMQESERNLQRQYDALIAQTKVGDQQEIDAINKIEDTVREISNLLFKVSTTKSKPEKFISEFTKIVKTSAKATDTHMHLRYIANKKYNGIIDHLIKKYNLTTPEADLCSMICLDFSIDTVRVLFGHENLNSLYNRRSKLKAKLSLEAKDHIDDFIKDEISKLTLLAMR